MALKGTEKSTVNSQATCLPHWFLKTKSKDHRQVQVLTWLKVKVKVTGKVKGHQGFR